MSSASEYLTLQFYQWENWGRGVNTYDSPVDIEPPFHPFFSHEIIPIVYKDDTKRESLLNRFANLFTANKERELEVEQPIDYTTLEPYPFLDKGELQSFSLTLPKGSKVSVLESEQVLIMLSNSSSVFSFEIIANSESTLITFVCRVQDVSILQSQIKAYFPEIVIEETEDLLIKRLEKIDFVSIMDFTLKEEFMRPLNCVKNFTIDPHIGLIASLESLKKGECGLIQVLFKGTVNPWAGSILRSVTDKDGTPFFMDSPEMLPLAKEKVSTPLYSVVIRVLGASDTMQKSHAISERIGNALMQIYSSDFNALIPLYSETYDVEKRLRDIVLRESHQLGMLLNSKELVTIVHPPSAVVASQKLIRNIQKTKPAPYTAFGHLHVIGSNFHQGVIKEVSISPEQRFRHTHIIGATGTGKSTLLLNLIVQDMEQGNGFAVLDPHGDLIDTIISHIPEHRINDVLIIDPSDSDFPIGFNILSAHSEIEKEILSSDLVAVFRRLSTSWGDQMNSVFANAILAFLESKQGGTLADLRRFLIEKSFRDSFLKTVNDPNVIYYWQKEFPILKSSSIGSILTRLDTFLRPKLIRNMVAQKKGLDFEQLMDSKKIILVKLSQGLIGAENSYLLGTVIVSKIYQSALARQTKQKELRSNFFLYIDEFQNFICPSMSGILSGARKYHLGLILAHQDMQQLQKYDSELTSSVISNVGTRICFRIGDTDAKKFADGFSFFEASDLQGLGTGEAIARIDRSDFDFNLAIEPLPIRTDVEGLRNTVIQTSRDKNATPRHEVENILRETETVDNAPQDVVLDKVVKEPDKVIPEPQRDTVTSKTKEVEPESVTETKTKENLVKQKEQSQHRYLQTLIKKMAESRGYKALIEEPTPDGKGRVDVLLEKDNKQIACEISVTTTDEWEIHNIQKCISAGYRTVVACSNDKKTLQKIRKQVEGKLSKEAQSKIQIFEPEELFLYLDTQGAKEASSEKRVKGYRVKVDYNALTDGEAKSKQESILKVITNSVKKK